MNLRERAAEEAAAQQAKDELIALRKQLEDLKKEHKDNVDSLKLSAQELQGELDMAAKRLAKTQAEDQKKLEKESFKREDANRRAADAKEKALKRHLEEMARLNRQLKEQREKADRDFHAKVEEDSSALEAAIAAKEAALKKAEEEARKSSENAADALTKAHRRADEKLMAAKKAAQAEKNIQEEEKANLDKAHQEKEAALQKLLDEALDKLNEARAAKAQADKDAVSAEEEARRKASEELAAKVSQANKAAASAKEAALQDHLAEMARLNKDLKEQREKSDKEFHDKVEEDMSLLKAANMAKAAADKEAELKAAKLKKDASDALAKAHKEADMTLAAAKADAEAAKSLQDRKAKEALDKARAEAAKKLADEKKAFKERQERDAKISKDKFEQELKNTKAKAKKERDALEGAKNAEIYAQEKSFNNIMSMVQDVYHVDKQDLGKLDSIRAVRNAIEQLILTDDTDVTDFKDEKIKMAISEDGPIKDAFAVLWKVTGATDEGITVKQIKELMEIILMEFNPTMYKYLLSVCREKYPDEDDMPDALETFQSNWIQNKDPPELFVVDKSVSEMIKHEEDEMGEKWDDDTLISKAEYVDYFFENVVSFELLAPSWEYIELLVKQQEEEE